MSPAKGSDAGGVHPAGSSSPDTAQAPALTVVGRLGAPHGVRGWNRIQSFTDPQANLFEYSPWHVDVPGRGVVQIAPEQSRQAQGRWVVKLPGIDDRDAAAALSGRDVRVDPSQFAAPALDEFFWHELEGMSVANREGLALGTVARLLETGAHDILAVRGDRGELLIPFVAEFVDTVSRDQSLITVDWQPDW